MDQRRLNKYQSEILFKIISKFKKYTEIAKLVKIIKIKQQLKSQIPILVQLQVEI